MNTFLEHMCLKSSGLYRLNNIGFLTVRIDQAERWASAKCADRPLVHIYEHRMSGSQQRDLAFDAGAAETGTELPAGQYTVAVTARGYQTHRELVDICGAKTHSMFVKLIPAVKKQECLVDILKRNLAPDPNRPARSLKIEEGETIVLDEASREFEADSFDLRLDTIDAVKAVLGNPDSLFVGKAPRFGANSVAAGARRFAVNATMSNDQRSALQEYVFGNSASVAHWEGALNEFVAVDPVLVRLFFLLDIDVGKNATLVVGAGGLLCNTLSVHYTGKVRIKAKGPAKIEMNHYVRYGFWDSVIGIVTQPWNAIAMAGG